MSLFHWSMRNAAGLLFAGALAAFLIALVPFLLQLGATIASRPSGYGTAPPTDWVNLLTLFAGMFAAPVWPLFGAAILYRLDRRDQTRATFGATHD